MISMMRKPALTLLCAGLIAGAVGCGTKDDAAAPPPAATTPAPTTAPPATSADATKPVTPDAPPAATSATVGKSGAKPDTTAAKPGKTVKMADGLVYTDTKVGAGDEATAGKTVVVNYVGTLKDGSQFDTSIGRAPFEFLLGGAQVIKGWDEGVQGMKVGGVRKLVIPAELAYGKEAKPGIPADSTLLFTVELLQVK